MQANEFNRIQEDVLRGCAESAERVGWFSGAAISLSFTLFVFLLSKESVVTFIHSNMYVLWSLIASWIFLTLAVLGSLLMRLLSEKWMFDTSSHLYLMSDPDEFAQEINRQDPSLAKTLQIRANKKSWWLRWIERVIYISGIFGVLLLLFFLIKSTLFLV
jgi:hypothetical protein